MAHVLIGVGTGIEDRAEILDSTIAPNVGPSKERRSTPTINWYESAALIGFEIGPFPAAVSNLGVFGIFRAFRSHQLGCPWLLQVQMQLLSFCQILPG
jgi:hypothetical protein